MAETDVLGDEDSAIFGVFDGHGGAEVARFCQAHLMGVLMGDSDFSSSLPPTVACSVRCLRLPLPPLSPLSFVWLLLCLTHCSQPQLVRGFHELDCMMRTKASVAELQQYKWRETGEEPSVPRYSDREQVRAPQRHHSAAPWRAGSMSLR